MKLIDILKEIKIQNPALLIWGETLEGDKVTFELNEHFELNVFNKNLTKLTVKDRRIKKLYCFNNKLTTLNVSNLPNLEVLSCFNNNLTTLNVSNLPNLEYLYCSRNNLNTLELSNLPNFKELYCSRNNLNTLDLSNLPNLETLDYDENKTKLIGNINEVKIQKPALIWGETLEGDKVTFELNKHFKLNVFNKNLTKLTVKDKRIKELYCSDNKLTTLNVSNLPNLEVLSCSSNNLTTLNLGNLPNLEYLYCSNNNLTTLNISNLPNLEYLHCSYNELTTLELSNLPNFKELYCSRNNLNTLDLSNLPNLEVLSYDERKTKLIGNINEVKIQKPSEKIIPISLDTFKKAFIKYMEFEDDELEEWSSELKECNNFSDIMDVLDGHGWDPETGLLKFTEYLFIRK